MCSQFFSSVTSCAVGVQGVHEQPGVRVHSPVGDADDVRRRQSHQRQARARAQERRVQGQGLPAPARPIRREYTYVHVRGLYFNSAEFYRRR